MGVFCQISLWWERREPGKGACGRAGVVSSLAEVVSSPEDLAFHVQSGKIASAWLRQRRPAVVGWFFPCVYLVPCE